ALLSSPCFVEGETCQGLVESEELAERAQELDEKLSHEKTRIERASDGAGQTRARVLEVELDGRRHEIRVHAPEPGWAELARRHRERSKSLGGDATGAIVSPMQGTVLEVAVADGDEVDAGALICVVEAMKMENEIVAHRGGLVVGLRVSSGEQVAHGDLICLIETELASV
ncbi:MAG: hypothetical protein M3Q67_06185, partial [Actinomycetota bacterium]|nr:hypothetical protein [Actinomycetota bacterium]